MAGETRVVVVGGGAAGFFAAIACAEQLGARGSVTIYEATAHPLAKVRVSGGGRCNVTHACFEPRELVKRYPRGARELLGAFHRFQPRDTIAWFAARGVELKAEEDGRMFPVTDDSATIVDCLQRAAAEAGVRVVTSLGVRSVEAIGWQAPLTGGERSVQSTQAPRARAAEAGAEPTGEAPGHGQEARATVGYGRDAGAETERAQEAGAAAAESEQEDCERGKHGQQHGQDARASAGFWLTLTDGTNVRCEKLLIATGGNRSSVGLEVARALGHTIEPPVPSLFTFHIDDRRLEGLSGVSVERSAVAVKGTKLKETGPLLITHWGLSGPAVLKLSAWGARELAAVNYEFPLIVNWSASHTRESLLAALAEVRTRNAKKQIATWSPLEMPQRLWERLVGSAGVAATTPWAQVGNAALAKLAAVVTASEFAVVGKSLFKEEFVTCGGVRLSEVDFRTMESRLCAGLHFAGEVLDVDGITGGFNFQAAWTTGWLAAHGMAAELAARR